MLRSVLFICCLTVNASLCESRAQESTREDFNDYCRMMEGRWIGDVVWVADWPGFGNKGDKVTAYLDWKVTDGGHALVGKYYGGAGSGTILTCFDAGSRQIKETAVSSGGTVWNTIIFRKDGKWMSKSTGSNPDGSEIVGNSVINISDDGKTHRMSGSTTIGGEKVDELRDVWRRLGK